MRLLRSNPRLLTLAACAAAGLAAVPHPAAGAAFAAAGKLSGLGTGRVWDVAVDPAAPAVMLAASDAGVFVSGNAGATWTLSLPGVHVWCAGFDARNPAVWLAGSNGQGVYSSSDSGKTWAAASTGLRNLDVRALAFGLDGIAAATDDGVAVSPDGRNWHDAGLDGHTISSVVVAANYPQFTLIAGADGGNGTGGYLYRNTGGSTWEVLQSGLPDGAVVSSIASGPIDQAFPKRPLLVATSKGLLRSGDGGTTWTQSSGIPDQVIATAVVYSPLDPSLAYAAADAGGSKGGGLFRSVDSGTTFAAFDQGLPSAGRNVEAITVATSSPPTVLAGIDPPEGGGLVFTAVDDTAPAPPALTAEAPGAPVPTVAATVTPTPTAAPERHTAPRPAAASGLQQFASAAFHWPTPLAFEILFVLLAAYVVVRWRQRHYVEGPP